VVIESIVMKKWISIVLALLLLGLALHVLFQMYPTRLYSVHFRTTTEAGCQRLVKRTDDIRMHLLADKRLISAYDLPENQSKKILFEVSSNSWPLYGVKGLEFEGTVVTVDSFGRNIGISINCHSSDRYSKKLWKLKRLISSIIGKEEMQDITISNETASIFPVLGDGAGN